MSHTEKEVSRIVNAGALGRSPVYERLLRYLYEQSKTAFVPKEVDIAAEVFGRDEFDPANDSTVRVYLHNLRQKLDSYYEQRGDVGAPRLTIPRGEYRLLFAESPALPALQPGGAAPRWIQMAGLIAVAAIAGVFIGRFSLNDAPTLTDKLADTIVWQPLLDDNLPVTVVVGDYYIFAERDAFGPGDRLIRDFGINDKAEFDAWIDVHPELSSRYVDVRLSYLPTGVGAALSDLLKVLHTHQKPVRIVPQSQFTAPMMRRAHIIYLGYLSGMHGLARYAFAASRLELGTSFDELIDTETEHAYVSFAGLIAKDDTGYTDYGYLSAFPGPAGNQFLFVSGMRDEGLMRMAATLVDFEQLQAIADELPAGARAFETLYEVSSVDRTDVAGKRLFAAALDAEDIWVN